MEKIWLLFVDWCEDPIGVYTSKELAEENGRRAYGDKVWGEEVWSVEFKVNETLEEDTE